MWGKISFWFLQVLYHYQCYVIVLNFIYRAFSVPAFYGDVSYTVLNASMSIFICELELDELAHMCRAAKCTRLQAMCSTRLHARCSIKANTMIEYQTASINHRKVPSVCACTCVCVFRNLHSEFKNLSNIYRTAVYKLLFSVDNCVCAKAELAVL